MLTEGTLGVLANPSFNVINNQNQYIQKCVVPQLVRGLEINNPFNPQQYRFISMLEYT